MFWIFAFVFSAVIYACVVCAWLLIRFAVFCYICMGIIAVWLIQCAIRSARWAKTRHDAALVDRTMAQIQEARAKEKVHG